MKNFKEEPKKKKLSIIIVNFSSARFLARLIRKIRGNEYCEKHAEIIVINHDTREERLLHEIAKKAPIQVISEENSGFAQGANSGARRASGEILFFLNPDTILEEVDFHEIEELFREKKKIGIVGAIMRDKSGSEDRLSFGEKEGLGKMLRRRISGRKHGDLLEWVSGGAMFVRKDAFVSIGGFDVQYFLYFEDMDMCIRAKKEGWGIARAKHFSVIHQGGKSFSSKTQQKKYYYDAKEQYLEKHFSKIHRMIFSVARFVMGK